MVLCNKPDGNQLLGDYEYVKTGVDDNVLRGKKTAKSGLLFSPKVDIKDVRPSPPNHNK